MCSDQQNPGRDAAASRNYQSGGRATIGVTLEFVWIICIRAVAAIRDVACTQGEAKALDILAKAQAARIRELDSAMVAR